MATRIAGVSGKNDKESAKNFEKALNEAFSKKQVAPQEKRPFWQRRPGDED